ncbi:HAD-IIB family hydrolase [Pedobacter sp. HMF7647]|uniref:HAD-IIB family hydrolase n=1 Tax=Hufsiella arboris TaxID=2695275 RepID=A0A7K1Y8A1_9SPHI|nr:HAD-IIB family hydrolase [Hufsiella arboris]MXV50806.1 HAD-IIB family hydrolase [Hufsiella arboris]
MRYHVLATDYDGTLAHHERVSQETIESLKSLKASGRKLILVTGRELDELKALFPEYNLFDRIVAENGALIYRPGTLEERLLGDAPPPEFVAYLRERNISPLSVGRVIVATWEPNQFTVLEAIQKLGIEKQVIFNKGAVMVLPAGINKEKGLSEAVCELGYSMHNVVAVGDAENDTAMMAATECSVAVSNALESVKTLCDFTTKEDHGRGVSELIENIIENDLADKESLLSRHHIQIGTSADNEPFMLSPYSRGVLLAGTSGGGKSTLTSAFIENLAAKNYQFCLIDPEGDYLDMQGPIQLGSSSQVPELEQIVKVLDNTSQSCVICTLAIPLEDRPAFFLKLLNTLLDMRKNYGHPHWFIFDEAHHLIPKEASATYFNMPAHFTRFFAITTKPELINETLVKEVDTIVALGKDAEKTIQSFAEIRNINFHYDQSHNLPQGEALVWNADTSSAPVLIKSSVPLKVMQRHRKKYATGDMGPDSFYFKGPEGKLNLKAFNLNTFVQLSKGVDDETWLFHLRNKDYSKWFKEFVNDDELSRLTEHIEESESDVTKSREAISKLVEERYTAPA